MTDYKILVQQIDGDGQAITVWVSEIRDAATEEQAFERFIAAYRNRPDRGEPPADGDAAASGKVFYALVCRLCGDPKKPLPMPFESPAERGKWAAAHTAGTGHDSWFVIDQTEDGP